MKTITVYGPGFRVVFQIVPDHDRAVITRTYTHGDRPSTVSNGRAYVARDLRIARQRADCTVRVVRGRCVDPDHGIGDHPCDEVLGRDRAAALRDTGY